jgi:imidazolonepropionase
MAATLLIRHAATVLTPAGPAPKRGSAQGQLVELHDAAIVSRDGSIVFVGPDADCGRLFGQVEDATLLDARGCTVVPGLVDPHTHTVFGGDRREELRKRLAGASYAQIAAEGGGIVSTVRATRDASEEALAAAAGARLDEMLAGGTTTVEIKSGYGLERQAELKMLRVIRQLGRTHRIDIVPTFMGAHEVPVEWRHDRRGYVDQVVREMIPEVAAEGLAEWCDVFCETGVYTPEESAGILEAGKSHGLKARIHADELAESGGSLVAARVGARSADHLLFAGAQSIAALAGAGVVATLLPIAAFYLKIGRYAPARDLIAAGVPVALATDLNPGGGFSPSMPFAMALGCFAMKMTFEEALVAATLNAAYAIDRHEQVGSLEVGKRMDAVVVNGDGVDLLRVGARSIRAVIKNGAAVA